MRSFIDSNYREEIEDCVDGMPQHTQKGEEGYLYRLDSQNTPPQPPVWAKKWYRSHDSQVTLPEEARGAALSPYFHALRMMEYDLAHQAFPEHTVEMVGAYDSRIDEDGLRIAPGHPTTITKEPAHDPELLARRNEIIFTNYREFFRRKARLRQEHGGAYDITDDPQILEWRGRTNSEIHAFLGRELDFPLMRTEGDLQRNVERLRDRNPNNIMIKMVQAGVYPIHPEFNYIPRKPSTFARPPHGTFIELRLYDPQKLEGHMRKKLGVDTPEFREFSGKLSMFKIYKKLDEVFNRLILRSNFGERDYLKINDDGVLTAIYNVLESLGTLYEKGIVKLDNEAIIDNVESLIANGFQSYSDPRSIAQHILQIEASFKRLALRG